MTSTCINSSIKKTSLIYFEISKKPNLDKYSNTYSRMENNLANKSLFIIRPFQPYMDPFPLLSFFLHSLSLFPILCTLHIFPCSLCYCIY